MMLHSLAMQRAPLRKHGSRRTQLAFSLLPISLPPIRLVWSQTFAPEFVDYIATVSQADADYNIATTVPSLGTPRFQTHGIKHNTPLRVPIYTPVPPQFSD